MYVKENQKKNKYDSTKMSGTVTHLLSPEFGYNYFVFVLYVQESHAFRVYELKTSRLWCYVLSFYKEIYSGFATNESGYAYE